jgi:hypothetical protein
LELKNDYEELMDLVDFLKKNIGENQFNSQQLLVIKGCLFKAAQYKKAVIELEKKETIPRTWSDLNKYQMFI